MVILKSYKKKQPTNKSWAYQPGPTLEVLLIRELQTDSEGQKVK